MLGRTKQVAGLTLWCGVALVLAAGGLRLKAEGQADKERKAALPAERVVASIWAAVAAKPGDVRAVEVEKKGDKLICEVEVLTLGARPTRSRWTWRPMRSWRSRMVTISTP
jgi:hypothetical protein